MQSWINETPIFWRILKDHQLTLCIWCVSKILQPFQFALFQCLFIWYINCLGPLQFLIFCTINVKLKLQFMLAGAGWLRLGEVECKFVGKLSTILLLLCSLLLQSKSWIIIHTWHQISQFYSDFILHLTQNRNLQVFN